MTRWWPLVAVALRCAVGPLSLAAFFVRWAEGPGVLAGTGFSGYDLVRFTGNLRALDLSVTEGAALWAVRLAILGVPVAGAWLTILAPTWRWHVGYALSGWYVVAFAAAVTLVGAIRAGPGVSPGIALLATAASLFVVSWIWKPRT